MFTKSGISAEFLGCQEITNFLLTVRFVYDFLSDIPDRYGNVFEVEEVNL